MENAKIEKFKCDILGDFQTLCSSLQTATWMKKANIIQIIIHPISAILLNDGYLSTKGMKEDVRQVAPASTTSNKEFHFYDYSALNVNN